MSVYRTIGPLVTLKVKSQFKIFSFTEGSWMSLFNALKPYVLLMGHRQTV